MTGYQEVITDPSYYGQILTFTYPEIGNTGINFEDSESDINVNGIIVRNFSSNNTNWRSEKSFDEWLIEKNIVGLYGIDTRALVKILRSNGSMNGLLTSENKSIESCLKIIAETPKMEGLNLSRKVSTTNNYLWNKTTITKFDERKIYSNNEKKFKIIAIDFGIKKSILNRLISHGCKFWFYLLVLLWRMFYLLNQTVCSSQWPKSCFSFEGITLAKSLIEYGEIPMFGICSLKCLD